MASNDIIRLNVGGSIYATSLGTLMAETSSVLAMWFDPTKANNPPLSVDRNGCFFIDRDGDAFKVVLNYLRLKKHGQLWEACLPKDPDRLALLTQEAEFYKLPSLRDGAVQLLQVCNERPAETSYVSQLLVRSMSCPMGLETDEQDASVASSTAGKNLEHSYLDT